MWAAALSSLILAAVCLSSSKAQQCKRSPEVMSLKGRLASKNNLGGTGVFMEFLDKGRAPGKMDIMDTSMSMISSAGAMTGTTVGSIMALSYPITIGGVLENYSKYYLTRVDCKNDAGYINKPLRAIHPEKKEVWASHRGMPGTASHVHCKIEVDGLEEGKEKLIHFYYRAPNAFSESNNNELWLTVCEKKNSNCKYMDYEIMMKYKEHNYGIEVVHSKFYYDVDELVTCGLYVAPDSRELCIVAKMGTSHNAEMYISVYGSKLKHANEKMQKAYADTKPNPLTQDDYAPFIESIKEGFNAQEGTDKRKKKVQKTFNGTKPDALTQDDYAPFIESIKEGFNAKDTGVPANNVNKDKKKKKQSMKKKKESTKKKKINTTKESKRDEIAEDEDDATVEEVEEEGATDIAGDEENAREKEFTNEEGDDKEEQEENGSGKAAIARESEEDAPAPAPAHTEMSNATDEGATKRMTALRATQLYDKAAHYAQVAEMMTAGASIVGTSVSAIMDSKATVAFAAHIENYSKYDLTKANCHASSGYINKPLRSIHSGTKEAFAAKQSSSGYGVYVYCKMRVAGAGVDKEQLKLKNDDGKTIVEKIGSTLKHYVHFMIYVPADKGNRGQYLGVAVCHDGGNDKQCEKIDEYALKADALYYGNANWPHMKRELYYKYQPDVYVCPPEQPVCVVATMGTSHKPIVYINVYGKTIDDAMPKMVEDMTDEKKEIKKENRDAYDLFISSWDNKAMVKLMKERREEEEKKITKKPVGGQTEEDEKTNKVDESGKDEPETTTEGR